MKAGTFNSYPSHSADLYVIRHSKPTNQEPIFHPPPGPKSTPVKSIITVNVNRLILVSVICFPSSVPPCTSICLQASPTGSNKVTTLTYVPLANKASMCLYV